MVQKNIIAIVGGKILQGNQFVSGQSLLIQDGKIAGLSLKAPKNFQVINASGSLVIPGFIDLHLHCDLPEKCKDPVAFLKDISRNHARFGTTRFLAAYCTNRTSRLLENVEALKTASKVFEGAQILGCHLEGPFINPKKAGAQPRSSIRRPSVPLLEKVIEIFGKNLVLMTLAPELKGIENVMSLLKRKNIRMAMGHTDATFEEAMTGFKMGVGYATHLFNQMRGFHHREPGAAGAALLHQEVFVEMIADGFHLDPNAVRMIVRVKNLDKIVLATDCFTSLIRGDNQNPPRLAGGTLAGSALSLRRALLNLVEFTRIPFAEAVRTATINPACAVGVERSFGSLEPGKYADMVLIDKKMNVRMTIVGGKIVYQR